jgi:hypothetical protein
LDNKEVVVMKTSCRITTCSDTEANNTPHQSRVNWEWASKTKGTGGEIHCLEYFRSTEGS